MCTVLLAVPVIAQTPAVTQTPAVEQRVNKLITLRNADPNAIAPLFNQWGVSIAQMSQLKTLSISGPADKVAAVEAAIKQLDAAPKTIELTVYFVVGGDQPNLTGGAVPQDLRDVIAQLKGAFTFKDYKMLDALTLRTRAGSSADTSGILNSANPPKMSQFSIRNATVSEDGTTIRIDRMHAGLRIPYTRREGVGPDAKAATLAQKSVEYINSGIDQDVDVKEGQKVVVGRSSLEGPQQALFLILSAHVVQ
jgi:hypothetical protein